MPAYALGDLVEPVLREECPFSPNLTRVETNHSMDAYLAGSAPTVPVTGADIDPMTPRGRLVLGVPVVVLAGKLKSERPRAVAGDQQDGPVLALAVGTPSKSPG